MGLYTRHGTPRATPHGRFACDACLQIVDMLAAATYLAGALEPWVALIVFITIGSYIPLTIIVTEWRGNFRRDMNKTGAGCLLEQQGTAPGRESAMAIIAEQGCHTVIGFLL